MNAGDKPKRSGLRQVPMPVAILVLLLCLAAGVGFLYWWLKRDVNQSEAIVYDGPIRGDRQRFGDRMGRGRPDDSRQRPVRSMPLRAAAGNFELRVMSTNDKPEVRIRPLGNAPATQPALVLTARRMVYDSDLAKAMLLTDAQRTRLRQLRFDPTPVLSQDDRTRLESLALVWNQAAVGNPKTEAEAKVIAALKEASARSTDAAKQAMLQTADQIKTILTPQQLDQVQQGTWKRLLQNRPAAQPANPTTQPARATTQPAPLK